MSHVVYACCWSACSRSSSLFVVVACSYSPWMGLGSSSSYRRRGRLRKASPSTDGAGGQSLCRTGDDPFFRLLVWKDAGNALVVSVAHSRRCCCAGRKGQRRRRERWLSRIRNVLDWWPGGQMGGGNDSPDEKAMPNRITSTRNVPTSSPNNCRGRILGVATSLITIYELAL